MRARHLWELLTGNADLESGAGPIRKQVSGRKRKRHHHDDENPAVGGTRLTQAKNQEMSRPLHLGADARKQARVWLSALQYQIGHGLQAVALDVTALGGRPRVLKTLANVMKKHKGKFDLQLRLNEERHFEQESRAVCQSLAWLAYPLARSLELQGLRGGLYKLPHYNEGRLVLADCQEATLLLEGPLEQLSLLDCVACATTLQPTSTDRFDYGSDVQHAIRLEYTLGARAVQHRNRFQHLYLRGVEDLEVALFGSGQDLSWPGLNLSRDNCHSVTSLRIRFSAADDGELPRLLAEAGLPRDTVRLVTEYVPSTCTLLGRRLRRSLFNGRSPNPDSDSDDDLRYKRGTLELEGFALGAAVPDVLCDFLEPFGGKRLRLVNCTLAQPEDTLAWAKDFQWLAIGIEELSWHGCDFVDDKFVAAVFDRFLSSPGDWSTNLESLDLSGTRVESLTPRLLTRLSELQSLRLPSLDLLDACLRQPDLSVFADLQELRVDRALEWILLPKYFDLLKNVCWLELNLTQDTKACELRLVQEAWYAWPRLTRWCLRDAGGGMSFQCARALYQLGKQPGRAVRGALILDLRGTKLAPYQLAQLPTWCGTTCLFDLPARLCGLEARTSGARPRRNKR